MILFDEAICDREKVVHNENPCLKNSSEVALRLTEMHTSLNEFQIHATLPGVIPISVNAQYHTPLKQVPYRILLFSSRLSACNPQAATQKVCINSHTCLCSLPPAFWFGSIQHPRYHVSQEYAFLVAASPPPLSTIKTGSGSKAASTPQNRILGKPQNGEKSDDLVRSW